MLSDGENDDHKQVLILLLIITSLIMNNPTYVLFKIHIYSLKTASVSESTSITVADTVKHDRFIWSKTSGANFPLTVEQLQVDAVISQAAQILRVQLVYSDSLKHAAWVCAWLLH